MVDTLFVFSRSGCHLCDALIDEVRRAVAGQPVSLNVIDIDSDPALASRYGARVPVLVADDEEVCHFRLDHERLAIVLSAR